MSQSPDCETGRASLEAYLLGQVDYEACLALQQRLVYELSGRDDGQVGLVICEHPAVITVGREGSRSHVAWDDHELAAHKLALRWVNRGGGCMVHVPGQLAVYPIVPLAWHRLTVGNYLQRLQQALIATLTEVGIVPQTRPGRYDLWGRTGQLAAVGVAVKGWTSYHGAFLNVAPALHAFERVQSDPQGRTAMSSLTVERQQAVRIPRVREALVRNLADAIGCDRYHVYTAHPWLRLSSSGTRVANAG